MKIVAFWDIASCSLFEVDLVSLLYSRHRENLKSYTYLIPRKGNTSLMRTGKENGREGIFMPLATDAV
jgi:hypothetical protein